MSQTEKTNGSLTLSVEQVKELRNYLVKQPYEVVNPIVIFLAQIEAEQARTESTKVPESKDKEESKDSESKSLKKVK